MAEKVLGYIIKNEAGQTLDRYLTWRDHEKGDEEAYVHAPDALFGEAMLDLNVVPSRVISAQYDPDRELTIVCDNPPPTLYVLIIRSKLILLQNENIRMQTEIEILKEALRIITLPIRV